jgi:hypothetical protein
MALIGLASLCYLDDDYPSLDEFGRGRCHMATQAMSTKAYLEKRRQETRRKRGLAAGLVLVGALLVGAAFWLSSAGRASAVTSFDYRPEDVARAEPFQAIHDMEQGPPIPFLPNDGPQPEIAVNERFYDFGSIGPTEVVTREFVVANLGDAPLTISRAYTTCGCTTADFTSSVIPPGEVVLVTLRFDAGFHDTAGQTVRRGIIIENNDPDRSSAEIWVQAAVRTNS